MGLIYLRLYVRQSLLGYLFDLDESNISRELHTRLLPVLLEVLPVPLRDAPLRHLAADAPKNKTDKNKTDKKDASADTAGADKDKKDKPHKRIGTLKELFAAYPDRQLFRLRTIAYRRG